MSRTAVLLSLSALMLAGCASRNACVGDTEYQQAVTLPPPANPAKDLEVTPPTKGAERTKMMKDRLAK